MSLLQSLKDKFRRPVPEPPKPLLTATEAKVLDASIQEALSDDPKPSRIPHVPRGRVIKQTRHAEFNPNTRRKGGRVVKVMPHQLQKIKEAQEKVEDDDSEN